MPKHATNAWRLCDMQKLALLLIGSIAVPLSAANSYYRHNLVSDLTGLADHVDPNLVNPWGNAFGASTPFWIANNGSGTSTLYDGTGNLIPLVVNVPAGGGATTPGKVTGVIFSGASTFKVGGQTAFFIFCTEDGTISGWNPSVDKTHAKIMVDNSKSGAQYKGCTVGGTSTAPLLYAADLPNGKIDVWDANLNAVTGMPFTNSAVPSGFGPFNIQNLGGTLYVAYAQQSSRGMPGGYGYGNMHAAAAGSGYVASFNMSGVLVMNMSGQGALNSPWGLAIAPAAFGDFAGMLLVGNFGDGMIHAFNPSTGAMAGTLNDENGAPIAIDGLWSLNFGNGTVSDQDTLYFTAGIQGRVHGLLGSLQAAPSFVTAGIENAASADARIAPNSYVAIFGNALAATSRGWVSADFMNGALPTTLDGVSVSINGEAAYINFVNPLQLDILIPPDVPAGPVQIEISNNGLTSAMISATVLATAPAFFTFGPKNAAGNEYIAATHGDNTPGGPPNYVMGVASTPFREGETIVLYGNGFGPTNPAVPKGQLVTKALPLATMPTVTIGGLSADVQFAGLSATGLYQFNVVVPKGLTPGTTANIDVPVVIDLGGGSITQPNAVISVVNPTK